MNPSYFRIKLGKDEAIDRLSNWLNVEINNVIETDLSTSVEKALDNGSWKGPTLYFYNNAAWTVFEDLSGHYSSISAEEWLKFAKNDDFIFAGYNDAIGYGEYVLIKEGIIQNAFFEDSDDPDENLNICNNSPITLSSWTDVASIVDDDELYFSDDGWLWINEKKS